jgi:hypothetical protein
MTVVWTDPPYGVSYGQKTDWNNTARKGSGALSPTTT